MFRPAIKIKRFSRWLLSGLLAAAVCIGAEAAGTKRVKNTSGLVPQVINTKRYYFLRDIARHYHYRLRLFPGGAELTGASRIKLYVNRRAGELNRLHIFFLFAPIAINGRILIHEKDLYNVLDPVIGGKTIRRRPGMILIDPGHGGDDPGALYGNAMEKHIAYQLALELASDLRAAGYPAMLTRHGDRTTSLRQRTLLCQRLKPAVLVSLHCNAHPSSAMRGVETYLVPPVGCMSTNSGRIGRTVLPGNRYDANNFRLAYEIQRSLIAALKTRDQGIKHARFVVLRDSVCPAVLVETGFLSSPRERALLLKTSYRRQVAAAICAGLRNYFGIMKRSRKAAAGN